MSLALEPVPFLFAFAPSPSLRPGPCSHFSRSWHQTPNCCTTRISGKRMREISSLQQVIHQYDAVFLDQFGVIHDGQKPYPNALRTISKLHEAGIKTIILSNSSKQTSHSATKLEKMGVHRDTIHGVVTSGQIALNKICELMSSAPLTRVLHITWASGRGTISTRDHNISRFAECTRMLNNVQLPAPEDVDLILAHGTEGISTGEDQVQAVALETLRELCTEIGRKRPHVPFYCANPDVVTVDGPVLRVMPGSLARDFEMAGGRNVLRLGKPASVAYEAAFKLVEGVERSRVLAIGDSLGHDIYGAIGAGIDSLYVAGGINANAFGIKPLHGFDEANCRWEFSPTTMQRLIDDEAPELGLDRPTYVCSFLRW
eukprot:GFKZ01011288.1.p1 GENE.GFKZ01011288.1~~GFKZ01011288.1.p1  ORF type:complete len:372 (-),score=20.48 GFKZ01011288.1:1751-2866(-)